MNMGTAVLLTGWCNGYRLARSPPMRMTSARFWSESVRSPYHGLKGLKVEALIRASKVTQVHKGQLFKKVLAFCTS